MFVVKLLRKWLLRKEDKIGIVSSGGLWNQKCWAIWFRYQKVSHVFASLDLSGYIKSGDGHKVVHPRAVRYKAVVYHPASRNDFAFATNNPNAQLRLRYK